MAKRRQGKKAANSLMAVSSAAVLAVYAAGYTRTRSAAERLQTQFGESRPAIPVSARMLADSAPSVPVSATSQAPAAADPIAPAQTTKAAPIDASRPSAEPVKVAKVEAAPAVSNVAEIAPAQTAAVKSDAVNAAAPATDSAAPASATAPAPAAPAPAADPYKAVVAAAAPPWKDGSYSGWGSCRHGDLEVTVTIQDGKIVSAPVTNCQTRYSCDIIDKVPPQVLKRQSPNVDYVGGATQSTDAYYWALVVALGKAH